MPSSTARLLPVPRPTPAIPACQETPTLKGWQASLLDCFYNEAKVTHCLQATTTLTLKGRQASLLDCFLSGVWQPLAHRSQTCRPARRSHGQQLLQRAHRHLRQGGWEGREGRCMAMADKAPITDTASLMHLTFSMGQNMSELRPLPHTHLRHCLLLLLLCLHCLATAPIYFSILPFQPTCVIASCSFSSFSFLLPPPTPPTGRCLQCDSTTVCTARNSGRDSWRQSGAPNSWPAALLSSSLPAVAGERVETVIERGHGDMVNGYRWAEQGQPK